MRFLTCSRYWSSIMSEKASHTVAFGPTDVIVITGGICWLSAFTSANLASLSSIVRAPDAATEALQDVSKTGIHRSPFRAS